MPTRDAIHEAVVNALVKEGWMITDDPFVVQFGGRTLFIDLAANSERGFFIGAERSGSSSESPWKSSRSAGNLRWSIWNRRSDSMFCTIWY